MNCMAVIPGHMVTVPARNDTFHHSFPHSFSLLNPLAPLLQVRLLYPDAAPQDLQRLDERFRRFANCELGEECAPRGGAERGGGSFACCTTGEGSARESGAMAGRVGWNALLNAAQVRGLLVVTAVGGGRVAVIKGS